MSGIKLEEVTKVYPNGVKAVDAVSLDIFDGEFVVELAVPPDSIAPRSVSAEGNWP